MGLERTIDYGLPGTPVEGVLSQSIRRIALGERLLAALPNSNIDIIRVLGPPALSASTR